MVTVYFLETGSDPSGKSVRRVFSRDLPKWSPRWDLLAELQAEIDRFDSKYRTPEYHNTGSILRKELLGGDAMTQTKLSSLVTPMMNGVWTVLFANISGQPHNLGRLGRTVHPEERMGTATEKSRIAEG